MPSKDVQIPTLPLLVGKVKEKAEVINIQLQKKYQKCSYQRQKLMRVGFEPTPISRLADLVKVEV